MDAYDVCVAFDDLYGEEAMYPHIDIAHILGEVVREVRRKRFASPPVRFEVLGDLFTYGMYQPPDPHKFELIGSGFHVDAYAPPDPKHYSIIGGVENLNKYGLNRFADYYRKFKDALPSSKLAVVEKRLSTLEAAFADHIADGHGTFIAGDAEMIPLPHRKDAICWQKGKIVGCSVKCDGGYLTTKTSIMPVAAQVMGAAVCLLGDDGIPECIPSLYSAAQVLTGDQLANELCAARRAAPRRSVMGVIRSKEDPAVCAAVALLQRCEKGDSGACEEMHRLAGLCGTLVEDASKKLRRRSWWS